MPGHTETAVAEAQARLAEILRPGDTALDLTAGNGHDTLFLARAVSPGGRVLAIDIQEAAVSATRTRLEKAGLAQVVQLARGDHALLAEIWRERMGRGGIRAAIANLGYLPGGDKARATTAASSVAALSAAVGLLESGGRLAVVYYTGHPQGPRERDALLAWADGLKSAVTTQVTVNHLAGPAERRHPPGLVLIERG